MKLGDLVVRAYAFEKFTSGIIVDIKREKDDDIEDFVILWDDGTSSEELRCELDCLDDALTHRYGQKQFQQVDLR